MTDTSELLGAVALKDVADGRGEIGYWVAPECRGRGVAETLGGRDRGEQQHGRSQGRGMDHSHRDLLGAFSRLGTLPRL